ncbi:MAG: hypothetical protein IT204_12355 [Fimbriimonadaceae bacterium]|nr:hypothetical protein [Fimbriimonadaceae bacterium]
MLRWTATACLLLLAAPLGAAPGGVIASPATWKSAQPVKVGVAAKQVFRLKNTGRQAVTLLTASGSNGINLHLPKKQIAPGETLRVMASLVPPDQDTALMDFRGDILFYLDSPQDRILIPVNLQVRKPAAKPAVTKPPLMPDSQKYQPRAGDRPVRVVFFYSGGCGKCQEFLEFTIRPAEAFYSKSRVTFELHDTGKAVELKLLDMYKDQYGLENTVENTYLFVGSHGFAGNEQIQANLTKVIKAELQEPSPQPAFAADPKPLGPSLGDDVAYLRQKSAQYRPLALFVAGLADGINPCAIATAVFLIVMLTRLGQSRRVVVTAGGCFALAVFVTYYGVGLGVIQTFSALLQNAAVARGFNAVVGVLALLAGALQARDAWRARGGAATGELTMQLPLRLKQLAHRFVREGLRAPVVGLGAAAAGVLVTLLEAVCTGQVYVPVLAALAKTGSGTAYAQLAVYNLGFVAPLVLILGLASRGVTSAELAASARRYLVPGKVALALVLLALGAYLLLAGH